MSAKVNEWARAARPERVSQQKSAYRNKILATNNYIPEKSKY